MAATVLDFYVDRTVFLTGVSGLLGKITLEKLLRTCRVKKVYVLLRGKKGKSAEERLRDIFDGPAFRNLRKTGTEYENKVVLVKGDCGEPLLGLKDEDVAKLEEEVEIVMHWAATLNFEKNLKLATYSNVRAVRDLLELARRMPKLQAFLYASTAYSNCPRKEIDEVIYDLPISGVNLLQIMDAVDEDVAGALTKPILGEWPNTYVYTKASAENLIKTEARGLPVVVFRPSIVIGASEEPMEGYIDNLYGIVGITVLVALGILRVVNSVKSNLVDSIPADFVVNGAMAAIWDIGTRKPKDIQVYNCVSSNKMPTTIEKWMRLAEKACWNYPTEKMLWVPIYFIVENRALYKVCDVVLHKLPARIVDFVLGCLGRKKLAVSGYKKIDKFMSVLTYFSTRKWKFSDDNLWRLWDSMCIDDRDTFNFDLAGLDQMQCAHRIIRGARELLLKETLDTVPNGWRNYYKLLAMHYGLLIVLCYLLDANAGY